MKRHVLALPFLCLLGLGCSDSSSTPSTTTAKEAAPPAAVSDETRLADLDKLTKGLDFPGLPEKFAEFRDDWKKSPTDVTKVSQFLEMIARFGQLHEEMGSSTQATDCFLAAEAILKKGIADGVAIEPRLQGIIHYHLACMSAEDGDAAKGFELLEKAIELGFAEMSVIKSNPKLAEVRKLPAFTEKLDGWEQLRLTQLRADGRALLSTGPLFPFSFELTDINGKPMRLSDFEGKVCIVDIWGTWCGPCVRELPSFIQLQNDYGASGFQMIGLNSERGNPAGHTKLVQAFVDSKGINYPCALITDEVMGQVPDFQGFPTTLFIDGQGNVRAKLVGQQGHEILESVILALLDENAGTAKP